MAFALVALVVTVAFAAVVTVAAVVVVTVCVFCHHHHYYRRRHHRQTMAPKSICVGSSATIYWDQPSLDWHYCALLIGAAVVV